MGREEETRTCEKPNKVGVPNQKPDVAAVVDARQEQNKVQRFCFVNVRPKDAQHATSIIQDAAKLFEEMDQPLLQISEYLRQKAIDREEVISRLKNLQNDRLNGIIDEKKDLLTRLYMALETMSFPKSCSLTTSKSEKLQKHKLNFRMQHKMKNLAQEKHLFRDINVNQQRNNHDSTLSMQEFIDILWGIHRRYQHHHHHYNKKKCEKLAEEIKQFQETKKISKGLRETVRNQVKVICDELMGMSKQKRELDEKMRVAEKEIEARNEEIWSFHHKNLEDNKQHYHRNEASLFFLKYTGFDWIFKCCNLENDSIHKNTVYARNIDQLEGNFTVRLKYPILS